MTIMPDSEPEHEISPTAHLLDEIALYGYRPFSDEADPRPLPEERLAAGAVADMFDALIATMIDTRIEPDLEDLCWSLANLFHRAEFRIQRELDDNEDAQKRSQREQDGSEVKSVELERQIREGIGLIERRNAMEFMREAAADQFETHSAATGIRNIEACLCEVRRLECATGDQAGAEEESQRRSPR